MDEKLPDLYQRILDELGDKSLIDRLARDLGGQRFYIPTKVRKDHCFMQYGEKFFSWLVTFYSGVYLVFPTWEFSNFKKIQRKAEALARQGFSANAIARQLGIHYSSAQRIKKRVRQMEEKNLQIDLFDKLEKDK